MILIIRSRFISQRRQRGLKRQKGKGDRFDVFDVLDRFD